MADGRKRRSAGWLVGVGICAFVLLQVLVLAGGAPDALGQHAQVDTAVGEQAIQRETGASPGDLRQVAVSLGPEPYLSAGNYHTCALRVDGSVDCWGSNEDGQAADQPGPYVQVSVGAQHSCALRADGSVDCWGRNNKGQAEDQTGPYSQIEAGMFHTCGLRPNGAADCWGNNSSGEAEDQPGPFSQISAGYFFTVGLRQDGEVTIWGDDPFDPLDGPGPSGPYTQLAAGWAHTCALTPAGAADCFGNNNYGVATDQPGPFSQLSSDGYMTCGLRPDGTVKCWGKDPLINDGLYTQITVGLYHVCGLKPDGNIACWGANWLGQAPSLVTGPFGSYHTPPTAVDDAYSTNEEQPLQVPAPGVLANDSSAYSSPLKAMLFKTVTHGTLTLNANGSFNYTPAVDFSGVDDFTYTAHDGVADSKTATVRITVNNINDPPVAQSQSLETTEDWPLPLTLKATDPDGDPLTYTILTGPQHGTLSGTGANLTYTPAYNYFGSDTFTFKANDGLLDSNPATVSIEISFVLDHDWFSKIPPSPRSAAPDTDSSFSVGTGPMLDRYLFRSDGPIAFTIPIDRVVGRTDPVGHLVEPQKLVDNGIVPATVGLYLMVYDVDKVYSGDDVKPEEDRVYVNGHDVGLLPGQDKAWRVVRMPVPVSHIRFAVSACDEFGSANGQDYLSECAAAPIPGQNEIRIDIDSGNPQGWTWAMQVDWGQLSFEAARPILFVHGRGGSNDDSASCSVLNAGDGCNYWDTNDGLYYFGFRNILNQTGFLTVTTENYLGGEVTIWENGKRLVPIMESLKERYGVDRINIVAHSKGGLDARAAQGRSPTDVASLVTLATPHHGSYMGDVGAIMPLWMEACNRRNTQAIRNLSEAYVNDVFNKSYHGLPSTQYVSIYGEASATCKKTVYVPVPNPLLIPPTIWIPVPITYTCAAPVQREAIPPDKACGEGFAFEILNNFGDYKGINDFLVTTSSARLIGIAGFDNKNTVEYGPYFLNHHAIRAAISARGVRDTRITSLVSNLLDIRPDTAVRSAQEVTADTRQAVEASAASSLSVETGTIHEGTVHALPVGISTDEPMSFVLVWEGGDLTLELITPDDELITPATDDSRFIYEDYRMVGDDQPPEGGYWAAYHVLAPPTGEWEVRITAAASLPNDQVDWMLMMTHADGIAVSLETAESWQRLNTPVQLLTRVGAGDAPIPGAEVVVSVAAPDGVVADVTLYDDGAHGDKKAGDGLYGNTFMGDQFGIYSLSAKATGMWDGVSFSRITTAIVQVASGSAEISGSFADHGIDSDGDNAVDLIHVDVPLSITEAGEYLVTGELQNNSGTALAWASAVAALDAGQHSLPLEFDAAEVWRNGGSGRFKLVNLTLMDMTTVELPVQIDFKAAPYTTKSYASDDFQHPAIFLTGETQDYGVDTNGNGLFDELVVGVEVLLDLGGEYQWESRLIDGNGVELGACSAAANLPAGMNTLACRFDGNAIGASGRSGTFYLVDLDVWGDGGLSSTPEAAQTAAYSYRQFESAPPGMDLYLPAVLR